jgi:hypothetical protein
MTQIKCRKCKAFMYEKDDGSMGCECGHSISANTAFWLKVMVLSQPLKRKKRK